MSTDEDNRRTITALPSPAIPGGRLGWNRIGPLVPRPCALKGRSAGKRPSQQTGVFVLAASVVLPGTPGSLRFRLGWDGFAYEVHASFANKMMGRGLTGLRVDVEI